MRGIENHLGEFEAARVRVVAISVDRPEESETLRKKAGYTFLFLSDPDAETIRRYDLLHPGAGVDGHDIARPAEFLVDSSRVVRWANLTGDIRERATPDELLKAVRQLP